MDDDGGEPTASATGNSERTVTLNRSRRAVLTASVALSTGCLRLSEDGQGNAQANGTDSPESTDDESSQSNTDNPSSNQPADTIRVAGMVGLVNEDGDALDGISMNVGRRDSDSGRIELSAMNIEYVGPENTTTLIHASRGPPAFYLSPRRTEDGTNSLITTDDGYYTVQVPFQSGTLASGFEINDPVDNREVIANPELEPLEEGERASFQLRTEAGATTTVDVTLPDSLADSAGDSVTLLS